MDKRFPSISVKHFDYKFPLIRNTSGFSYSSNPSIKTKALHRFLPQDRQNMACSSLTITGLNDTMKELCQLKPNSKSKSSMFILRSKNKVKKLVPVPVKPFDPSEGEVKGWEYSKRSN